MSLANRRSSSVIEVEIPTEKRCSYLSGVGSSWRNAAPTGFRVGWTVKYMLFMLLTYYVGIFVLVPLRKVTPASPFTLSQSSVRCLYSAHCPCARPIPSALLLRPPFDAVCQTVHSATRSAGSQHCLKDWANCAACFCREHKKVEGPSRAGHPRCYCSA